MESPFSVEVMIHLLYVTSFTTTYWMVGFLPISPGARTVQNNLQEDTILQNNITKTTCKYCFLNNCYKIFVKHIKTTLLPNVSKGFNYGRFSNQDLGLIVSLRTGV